MNIDDVLRSNREFLQCDWWDRLDDIPSDQQQNKPRPEVQKPAPAGAKLIDLITADDLRLGDVPLKEVIQNRRSQRTFTADPLNLEELSFLLWATQGLRGQVTYDKITYYMRNVPSGGNRHPFETYLSIHNVTGLAVGLYRYLPLEHKLVLLKEDPDIAKKTSEGSFAQTSDEDGELFYFVEQSAVTFIWTVIPYRSEWRYGPAAAKLAAQDSGHICQNLYLACGAIGAGTVAMGAFNRQAMDQVLGVDGKDEFTFYMAPVGKLL